ncbi:MAG: N-6 DNA methylase, partial [Planctomycetes bacterium]|nr:N-6 DNA methylase [Planctomycetota bacterium]
ETSQAEISFGNFSRSHNHPRGNTSTLTGKNLAPLFGPTRSTIRQGISCCRPCEHRRPWVKPSPTTRTTLGRRSGGAGPSGDEHDPPLATEDALRNEPSFHADLVLTNPPFGKKSSITVVNDEGETDKESLAYSRPDFWTTTSNKQLNFVQHVKSLLKVHGRAAVVVPDNVLFEGGAGEIVRKKLLHECDVHTLLRLPTGIFYAQGVKANVLFFDRKPGAAKPWTKTLWVYDLRTNLHFTLKTKRMARVDLDEFVTCYQPSNRAKRKATWSESNPTGRWRPYELEELLSRDKLSLDLFWLRDESLEDSANLPDPQVLAEEIADDLRSALEQIEGVLADLQGRAQDSGA